MDFYKKNSLSLELLIRKIMKAIVANWKSYGSKALFDEWCSFFNTNYRSQNNLIIAPPAIYMDYVKKNLTNKNIFLGSQHSTPFGDGARTGDINSRMIKDIGADYVIIGHSETRQNFDLTNDYINKSIASALKNDLSVIFCIGDNLGDSKEFLIEQIASGLEKIEKDSLKKVIIAYEPLYSIGTGIIPEYSEIAAKRDLIEFTLKTIDNLEVGGIIYGGSVDEKNAKNIIKLGNMDGLIIGRASMNPVVLNQIINAIDVAD